MQLKEPGGIFKNQKVKKTKKPKNKLIKEFVVEAKIAIILGKLTFKIMVDFSNKALTMLPWSYPISITKLGEVFFLQAKYFGAVDIIFLIR